MYERNYPISNKSFTLGLDFVTNNAMMRRVLLRKTVQLELWLAGSQAYTPAPWAHAFQAPVVTRKAGSGHALDNLQALSWARHKGKYVREVTSTKLHHKCTSQIAR